MLLRQVPKHFYKSRPLGVTTICACSFAFIVLHIHLMSTRGRCPLIEQHQELEITAVTNRTPDIWTLTSPLPETPCEM